MKPFPFILLAVLLGLGALPLAAQDKKSAVVITDVDGKKWDLGQTGVVTMVLYTSQANQDKSRAAGRVFDSLRGQPEFRMVALVDLRETLADWAPGYTQRRILKNLDEETVRLKPFYAANGNKTDPRKEVGAATDFKGETCNKLGWTTVSKGVRFIIFDKDGKEFVRVDGAFDEKAVLAKTKAAMKASPAPKPPAP